MELGYIICRRWSWAILYVGGGAGLYVGGGAGLYIGGAAGLYVGGAAGLYVGDGAGLYVVKWTIFCFSCSQQLVPTTVERASHKVRKLLCTGWLLVTLISVVLVVSVLLALVGRDACDEHYIGTRTLHHPLSPVANKPYAVLWTLSPNSQSVFH